MFVNVNDVFRNVNSGEEITVVAVAPDTTRIVCERADGTPFGFDSTELENDYFVLVRGMIDDMYYRTDDDVISASEAGY